MATQKKLYYGNGYCPTCKRYVRTSTKSFKDDLQVKCVDCGKWIEILAWSSDALAGALSCHMSRGTIRANDAYPHP